MTNDQPIIAQSTYPASRQDVWDAITEPARMRDWYFETMEDFRAEKGFHTEFDIEHEGKVYRHCWTVTKVVPGQSISYDWSYQGYAGDGQVTWELKEADDDTQLTIRFTGSESFPNDDGVFSRESWQAGWDYFIESLGKYLQGESG